MNVFEYRLLHLVGQYDLAFVNAADHWEAAKNFGLEAQGLFEDYLGGLGEVRSMRLEEKTGLSSSDLHVKYRQCADKLTDRGFFKSLYDFGLDRDFVDSVVDLICLYEIAGLGDGAVDKLADLIDEELDMRQC